MQTHLIRSGKYTLTTLSLFIFIYLLLNIKINKPAVTKHDLSLPDGNIVSISTNLQTPRSFIGILLTNLTTDIIQNLKFADETGAYIQDIIRNSPGQNAGLLPGDIIIKINNVYVQNVTMAMQLLYGLLPNQTFAIEIFRNGKYLEFLVTPQASLLTPLSNEVVHLDKEASVN